jgi:hypothetical protein
MPHQDFHPGAVFRGQKSTGKENFCLPPAAPRLTNVRIP